jgi:cell division protein YceG involved in septum cleavage
MSEQCSTCPIKKELIEIATVLRDYFDIKNRFTWVEQGDYRIKMDKLLKRLNPQENDAESK